MPKIAVIVPTLNEEKNIEERIRAIFRALPEAILIVVDDASADQTQTLVSKLCADFSNLHLIARTGPRSFSQSYRRGFEKALEQGAEILVQMDADGSHNEEYLSAMIAKLIESDFVIGSRYAPGGGISQWSWARRLFSRSGNWYARAMLGLPYRDLTGGYNAWKAEVIRRIDFSLLVNHGYVFLVWLKWNAHRAGFRGVEVPIIFTERTAGRSKFNYKIIAESFVEIFKLRFKKSD